MRAVLLGNDLPVTLTRRARDQLAETRELLSGTAHPDGTVITRVRDEVRCRCRRADLPARVQEKASAGLKFSSALPARLAEATLAARLADIPNAATVLAEPVRFLHR